VIKYVYNLRSGDQNKKKNICAFVHNQSVELTTLL